MTKPPLSSVYSVANSHSWGPFYGLREGSGTTTVDDAATSTTALALVGTPIWVGKSTGPEVRTSAPGDYLSATDAAGLRRPTTAFTLAVGFTPLSWHYAGQGPLIAGKRLGYMQVAFGIRACGNGNGHVRAVVTLGGTTYYTQDSPATQLTNGTAYVIVARWQSGFPLNIRIYRRSTASLVVEMNGTTTSVYSTTSDIAPPVGAITYDAQPFLVGKYVLADGGNPDYAFGDYEFVTVSDRRLSDGEVDAFAGNPWADYSISSADYGLRGPTTCVPGIVSDVFTVMLDSDVNPVNSVAITPVLAGMAGTFSPTTVTLSTSTRSATFTLIPAMATAAGTVGTVSVTNAGTLANPDAVICTAAYPTPAKLGDFHTQLLWPSLVVPYVAGTGIDPHGSEHYDAPRCFMNVRDYAVANNLAVTDWSPQIAASLVRYRDRYVQTFGTVPFYEAFATGLARHYAETGDLDSRDAALFIDPANFLTTTALARYYKAFDASRETAFAILNSLEAEQLGRDHVELSDVLVSYSLSHLDQWTRPAGSRYFISYVRPFMVALTCEALITYWTRFRHNPSTSTVTIKTGVTTTQAALVAAIPAKIKTAIDWIWANCWYPDGMSVTIDQTDYAWTHGSFAYTDIDTFNGSMDEIFTSVSDATPTVSSFQGAAGLSLQDDFYRFAYLKFTSGALNNTYARVGGYVGSTRTFTLDDDYGVLMTAPANGDTFQIQASLDMANPPYFGGSHSGGTGSAPDLNHLIAPAFAWYYWYTVNVASARDNTYRQRHEDIFNGGAMCWSTPTAQKQYNQAVRWGLTGLAWRARGDSEYPTATTYTLTAPSPASGQANMPSGLFTVALPSGKSVANPITITPTCSTGHGSFIPTAAVLTTERPRALFRFVPDQVDANASVSLSFSNDGGLGNPASLSYAVGTAKVLAESYRAVGPATGTVNVAAPFALTTTPANAAFPVAWLRGGGGAITIQPNDQWVGGAFDISGRTGPTSLLSLSADRPSQNFTYTPKTVGAKSLSFPNSVGVPSPSALPFLVTATTTAVSSAAAMLLGM